MWCAHIFNVIDGKWRTTISESFNLESAKKRFRLGFSNTNDMLTPDFALAIARFMRNQRLNGLVLSNGRSELNLSTWETTLLDERVVRWKSAKNDLQTLLVAQYFWSECVFLRIASGRWVHYQVEGMTSVHFIVFSARHMREEAIPTPSRSWRLHRMILDFHERIQWLTEPCRLGYPEVMTSVNVLSMK
jgi:hypothetical protein